MVKSPRSINAIEEKVWSFDLEKVTNRLLGKGFHDSSALEEEFRRFAAILGHYQDVDLAPSKKVDLYWHEFILNTTLYRKFSDEVYGYYMDHIPSDNGNKMRREYEKTVSLYKNHYLMGESDVWNSPGDSMRRGLPEKER